MRLLNAASNFGVEISDMSLRLESNGVAKSIPGVRVMAGGDLYPVAGAPHPRLHAPEDIGGSCRLGRAWRKIVPKRYLPY